MANLPPNMIDNHTARPPVPGSRNIPGHGTGHGKGVTVGARNPRVTAGYQRRLFLATYNRRILNLDDCLTDLEAEVSRINWHILGLSKVRRQGEDTTALYSCHLLYFREGDQPSQGDVGFMIHKSLRNNVEEVGSVSSRVAYLFLKLSKREYLLDNF